VEYVLEGSVRSSGNRIRVTAQVVSAANGYQLWSERYDCEKRDVFDLQDEISLAIAETLRVRLAKDISLVRRHTSSPEAYSLYLRGRYYQRNTLPKGTPGPVNALSKGLQPIRITRWHISDWRSFIGRTRSMAFLYPKEALSSAKQAAARALEIDDALPEGYACWARYLALPTAIGGSGAAFHRALELDANSLMCFSAMQIFICGLKGGRRKQLR